MTNAELVLTLAGKYISSIPWVREERLDIFFSTVNDIAMHAVSSLIYIDIVHPDENIP